MNLFPEIILSEEEIYAYDEALRRQKFFIKGLIRLKQKQSRTNNTQREIKYLETKMKSYEIYEDLRDVIRDDSYKNE